jgi:hypothetical protein
MRKINSRKCRINSDITNIWKRCFHYGCEDAEEFTGFNYPQSKSLRFMSCDTATDDLEETIKVVRSTVFSGVSQGGGENHVPVFPVGGPKSIVMPSANPFPVDADGRGKDWTNYEPAYTNYISACWKKRLGGARKQRKQKYLGDSEFPTVLDTKSRRIVSIDPALEAWVQLQVSNPSLFARKRE